MFAVIAMSNYIKSQFGYNVTFSIESDNNNEKIDSYIKNRVPAYLKREQQQTDMK